MIKLKPTKGNIILVLVLAVMVVIGTPLALIWSLNTLFPVLAIPFTVETWLAAFLIPAALKANVNINKD
jgi:hypothetical protein